MEKINNKTLEFGDMVAIYINPMNIALIKLEENKHVDNRYGHFKHKDIVGKQFGDKVYSLNKKGFVFLLRPDPSIFTLGIPHQTAIIYFQDISLIINKLEVQRGHIVIESGTGSGSLTYSLSKNVGDTGKVLTFEFNKGRQEIFQEVIKANGLTNVKSYLRNVVEDGFDVDEMALIKADSLFLDLPTPHLVIPHAVKVLKRGANFCSFSPCIEQIQRTSVVLSESGFADIECVECVEREFTKRPYTEKYLFGKAENEPKDVYMLEAGESDGGTHTGYILTAKFYKN